MATETNPFITTIDGRKLDGSRVFDGLGRATDVDVLLDCLHDGGATSFHLEPGDTTRYSLTVAVMGAGDLLVARVHPDVNRAVILPRSGFNTFDIQPLSHNGNQWTVIVLTWWLQALHDQLWGAK